MEGLFEAVVQTLIEFVFDILAQVVSSTVENIGEISNFFSEKTDQNNKFSFSDEITKLNLFD